MNYYPDGDSSTNLPQNDPNADPASKLMRDAANKLRRSPQGEAQAEREAYVAKTLKEASERVEKERQAEKEAHDARLKEAAVTKQAEADAALKAEARRQFMSNPAAKAEDFDKIWPDLRLQLLMDWDRTPEAQAIRAQAALYREY